MKTRNSGVSCGGARGTPYTQGHDDFHPLPTTPAMEDPLLHTTQMRRCLERMQEGSSEARDELVRGICQRTEQLARRMLRGFPGLGRLVEAEDVLQNALMRLLRALEKLQPTSMREFFGLAALQIRRELVDLSRHLLGPQGYGKRMVRPKDSDYFAQVAETAEGASPSELERWTLFHQAVDELPKEEREVVELLVYHGRTQVEVADILGTSERWVRGMWQVIKRKLHRRLKDSDNANE